MGLFSRLRGPGRAAGDGGSVAPVAAEEARRLVREAHALADEGRADEALACCQRAVAIDGGNDEAQFALGNLCLQRGRFEDAARAYARVVEARPDLFAPHFNLAGAQRRLGKVEAAVESYRHAAALAPDLADAHAELGHALVDAGRSGEAAESFRRALAADPQRADVLASLGNAEAAQGRLTRAAETLGQALALAPDSADALAGLGIVLYRLGRLPEAIARFRQALERAPAHPDAWTGLLFTLSHDETVDADALYAEHLRFGRQFATATPGHGNARDPQRTIAVGIVSGDLRNHAVATFAEPILAQLAVRPGIALHAYSNLARGDEVTERLTGCFARWTDVRTLSDDALAAKIRADGIDVLIDLSGHTSGNRLPVFARRPAPVQASWLGYLGTTGLPGIDYYVADRLLAPAEFAGRFTERLVQLPAFAALSPPEDAPAAGPLPALANGYVTFGSFHRLSKLRPSVVALWSQVLRALPDARLLLGGVAPDGADDLVTAFGSEGVARERLRIYPRADPATYLGWHGEVDLCLDAFPYTGGVTTTTALWMGVPTVTFAGATPPWRQGAAIMGHVGLTAFVGADAGDFVRTAVDWAGRPAALAEVRAGLRDRCRRSIMGRPDTIADGFERALRRMWRRWCAGLPPEAFAEGGDAAP